jgi:hypothetical protein
VTVAEPTSTEPAAAPAASPTPTEIADAVGRIADDIAGGLDTGTNEGAQLTTRFAVDESALTDNDFSGDGTTTTGTTEDGRTYTQTDLGEAGFKREYDDTGTIQFFNNDGTAKGGELDPHTDTTGDDTNPYVGTTDDDGTDDEPDDGSVDGVIVDDGTSGEATAYVNPDADVIAVPVALAPVAAQMIVTGSDPTTTDPSGPYVDDGGVAPVLVTSSAVTMGVAVPMNPGVVDDNPDADPAYLGTGSFVVRIGADGPDVINPDDPVLGGTGEDINVGDFTPRPSVALTEGDEPASAFGLDPDPLD